MSATLIGINPAQVDTVPAFKLGALGGLDDPVDGYKEFIYGQATGALTAGQCVAEGLAGAWTPITTALSAAGQVGGHGTRVGFPQVAVANLSYGWFQVYGKGNALTAGAVAIGTRLNTTATSGAIDDDGTAGARPILGAVFKTAVGSATVGADCRFSYPTVGLTI